MKHIIILLTIITLVSCEQSHTQQGNTTVSDTPRTLNRTNFQHISEEDNRVHEDYQRQPLIDFKKASLYKITDTIKADFNGDGVVDQVYFEKNSVTSGVIIRHGETNEEIRIGFGKQFDYLTDFNWVDYWGLVEDKETFEVIFAEDGDILESREITLQNPSIFVGKDEVGGGLITFKNGEYIWIHQTC